MSNARKIININLIMTSSSFIRHASENKCSHCASSLANCLNLAKQQQQQQNYTAFRELKRPNIFFFFFFCSQNFQRGEIFFLFFFSLNLLVITLVRRAKAFFSFKRPFQFLLLCFGVGVGNTNSSPTPINVGKKKKLFTSQIPLKFSSF